jgi:hypothetical protein
MLSFVRCLKWWRVAGEKHSRKDKGTGIGAMPIVKYEYGAESDQAVEGMNEKSNLLSLVSL